ncbi:uncharacterized protein LOC131163970 [Malania oleifera]|uniref:uncharacterized protein LOC131163970 n=1 Tax=Malania oleifera TaxID=397392 RepID=UPI0025ADF0F6|nr:uncharacterized protein LOC131163970 [Malania oleifera]
MPSLLYFISLWEKNCSLVRKIRDPLQICHLWKQHLHVIFLTAVQVEREPAFGKNQNQNQLGNSRGLWWMEMQSGALRSRALHCLIAHPKHLHFYLPNCSASRERTSIRKEPEPEPEPAWVLQRLMVDGNAERSYAQPRAPLFDRSSQTNHL